MKLVLRFLGFLFAAGTILFVVGVAAAAGLLWHFSKDLPGLLTAAGLRASGDDPRARRPMDRWWPNMRASGASTFRSRRCPSW